MKSPSFIKTEILLSCPYTFFLDIVAVMSIRAGSWPNFGHLLSSHFTLNFDMKLKIMERYCKNIVRHPFQMSESNWKTDWKTEKIAFPSI